MTEIEINSITSDIANLENQKFILECKDTWDSEDSLQYHVLTSTIRILKAKLDELQS